MASEPHKLTSASWINGLRAAVLGANDGIVSVAGIVVGVAGANSSKGVILTAGIAGLAAGAFSMAAGEYVSVSSQKDTQEALIRQERKELEEDPEGELKELAGFYEEKGLAKKTAMQVAKELTAKDPLQAHAEVELKLDPDDLNNPWHAAIASAISFTLGSAIPIIAIELSPRNLQVIITFIAVLLALSITGYTSAWIGGANKLKATARVIVGGILAMLATYYIGKLIGHHIVQ